MKNALIELHILENKMQLKGTRVLLKGYKIYWCQSGCEQLHWEDCLMFKTTSCGFISLFYWSATNSVRYHSYQLKPRWLTVWLVAGGWYLDGRYFHCTSMLRYSVEWLVCLPVRLIDWLGDPWLIIKEVCSTTPFISSNEKNLQKILKKRDLKFRRATQPQENSH